MNIKLFKTLIDKWYKNYENMNLKLEDLKLYVNETENRIIFSIVDKDEKILNTIIWEKYDIYEKV